MKQIDFAYLRSNTKLRATARILLYVIIMITSVQMVNIYTIDETETIYAPEATPFLITMLVSFLELYRYGINQLAKFISFAKELIFIDDNLKELEELIE